MKKRMVAKENKHRNLDSVQGAAQNETQAGIYQPRDRCFQGVGCYVELSEDLVDVSLDRIDSSIWSVAPAVGGER
jgi:hypothetical protein